MTKHRKVSRKPARRSLEPVASEHRYLSQEFRDALRRKAYQHGVNADFRRSSDGKRFPKDLTETPVFQAIKYLRSRPYKVARDGRVLDCNPFVVRPIEQYAITAICTNQPGKLRDLAAMLELYAGSSGLEAKYIPWIYYTGVAALEYLDDGKLPTKHVVLKGAIHRRTIDELWASPFRGEALSDARRVAVKIEDITAHRSPRNWGHVFRVLDLTELPT